MTSTPDKHTRLAILLTGLVMANVDVAIVNVATPAIRDTFGASGAELQLVVSGYLVAYAMLLITAARLGQMLGYGRVFTVGAGVFTAASLACGFAPNAATLIAARVVQGVGGALMVAQVLTGIQLNFAGQERVKAIGSYAMALSGAAVIGQILGGVIVSVDIVGTTWRPAFLINVPIGLVLIARARRFLPSAPAQNTGGFDVKGVAALSVAVLSVLVPLIFGREQHWPVWTWLGLAASVPAWLLFARIERRVAVPLVDLSLVRQPVIGFGLLASGLALATYFGLLFVLALYLQQGLGKSPLYSGLVLVSWVAAFGLSGPLLRRVPTQRIARVAVSGYIILAVSYIAVSLTHPEDWLLMVLLGLGGLGLGLGRNATVADMTSAAPERFAADMSGLINTDSQIAGAAGVALFGTLYLSLADTDPTSAFAWTSAGFAATALVSVVTALPALRQRSTSDGRAEVPSSRVPAHAAAR
ncbi:MAG TPA: MFS transporter [Chloroflexota bacterium]|jgi:MFS family permease